jgi:hypothetical protein
MLNQKDTGKLPTTERSALCVLITTGDGAGGCFHFALFAVLIHSSTDKIR